MALIVEDGTGLSTAESYISVADADTYHSNRSNTAWTGTTSAKEAALRKATDYMEGAYGLRWKGTRLTGSQALSWPRYNAQANGYYVGGDEVPAAVANACAELALRALSGDLQADAGAQVVQETVGPISVTYAPGARQGTAYKAVDALVAAYLNAAGGLGIVRA